MIASQSPRCLSYCEFLRKKIVKMDGFVVHWVSCTTCGGINHKRDRIIGHNFSFSAASSLSLRFLIGLHDCCRFSITSPSESDGMLRWLMVAPVSSLSCQFPRFIRLKMSLRTRQKNQKRHVIVVLCAMEKCKWRNSLREIPTQVAVEIAIGLSTTMEKWSRKNFAGNTTQQLSIMVRFSRSFLVRVWPRSYATAEFPESAFRFLFECQFKSRRPQPSRGRCWCFQANQDSAVNNKIRDFNSNSLFLLLHAAYIAFMLLLLRHTCITFLLIGLSVKRNVHFMALPPDSISARERKTEHFQCALAWMKMKISRAVTSQPRKMHKSMHIILCFDTDFICWHCSAFDSLQFIAFCSIFWTAAHCELIKLYFHFVPDFFRAIISCLEV
jgi:hypothetical protein